MQQARSKKLMVSLCGLALSSVFLINNKAVVHADSVDGSQNNAISWDSDQDDSQVVTQQTNTSHTKTEQVMPQKADDYQQNATQTVQNNAEMSTVRSSSADRLSANQNETNKSAASVQNSRANLISNVDSAAPRQTPAQQAPVQAKQKVASVQDAQAVNPVVIKNPEGNKVHVNWVNSKDETIPNVNGYDIDLTKDSNQFTNIPTGYYLLKNDSYNITKNTHTEVINHEATYKTKSSGEIPLSGMAFAHYSNSGDHHEIRIEPGNFINIDYIQSSDGAWHNDDLDSEPVDSATQDALDSIWDQSDCPPYYELKDHREAGRTVNYDLSSSLRVLDKPAWTENRTITDGYTFTDNSGAVLKQSGNTINVGLIKPQHVDPATDARMRATATRTIKINFPGSIPPSYKNIVNDKGVLTQTVTFTRTGQEDALTGNLIDNTLTPWKSNNQDPNFLGFPERTLPRIPGYTLKITPVQA